MSWSFEGVLAALNDSIQTSAKYTGQTISQFIGTLLDAHNTKIRTKPTSRMVFYKGIVDVTDDNPDRYTEYETTLKCINDLVEDNGGHLKVRKDPNNPKRVDLNVTIRKFETGTTSAVSGATIELCDEYFRSNKTIFNVLKNISYIDCVIVPNSYDVQINHWINYSPILNSPSKGKYFNVIYLPFKKQDNKFVLYKNKIKIED